jgi:uncharacterized membrane protein
VEQLMVKLDMEPMELAKLTAQWERADRTVLQLTQQLAQVGEGMEVQEGWLTAGPFYISIEVRSIKL